MDKMEKLISLLSLQNKGLTESEVEEMQKAERTVSKKAFWLEFIKNSRLPRQYLRMESESAEIDKLIAELPLEKNIMIFGGAVTGKTFLITKLAKKLWEERYAEYEEDGVYKVPSIVMLNIPNIIYELSNSKNSASYEIARELIEDAKKANLVIIDSINDNQAAAGLLYNLIESRLTSHRQIWVTHDPGEEIEKNIRRKLKHIMDCEIELREVFD